MAQKNNSPARYLPKPAASGSSATSAKKNEAKKISNASLSGAKVGPAKAPYYQK